MTGGVTTQAWLYLAIAIVAEVIATSALKATVSFTRPGPSAIVIVGYGVAFYFLARTLETLPVGVTYAVWSGVGVLLITLIAWLVYGQTLDLAAVVGLTLIVAGVVVLNLFSKTVVPH
jgi:small multidrug resistance pump